MSYPETVSITENSDFFITFKSDKMLTGLTLNRSGQIIDTLNVQLESVIVEYDITENNEYILLLADSSEILPRYYLTKLNSSLENVWTTELYNVPQRTEPHFSFGENEIIVYSYLDSSRVLWVSHFNQDGINVSRSTFEFYFSQYENPSVNLIYKYGFYYLSVNYNFIKFDLNGEKVWSNYEHFYKDIKILDNRNILLTSGNNLFLYTPAGILLNNIDFNVINRRVEVGTNYITQQGDIVVGITNSILKYDSMLNPIWQEDVYFKPTAFCETGEGWIAGVGIRKDRIAGNTSHLVQIPPGGIQTPQVALLTPGIGQIFDHTDIRINVYTKNVDKIRVNFSSDGGKTWDNIYNSFIYNTIYWSAPDVHSSNCILSVEDASDPEIKSTMSEPFSIFTYGLYDFIDVNKIFMWIGNNGMSSHNPTDDDSGLYWGKENDTKLPVTFMAGILWGGKVNGEIRAGGSSWRYGLRPGPITDYYNHNTSYDMSNRIYKLSRDWQQLPEGEMKESYKEDYDNWPGQWGAPYEDVNWDKQFSPGIDKPKIIGEETLFYVANDMDEERTSYLYGSPPLGLEFRQTLFAFNTPNLDDVVFKKINLINKSPDKITEMYISYFSDDDLGFGGDDFSGCDSTLNLAYTYNADNYDDDWFGSAPPAVGRVLLQGPQINSQGDSAVTTNGVFPNRKKLPATSYVMYINASNVYSLPMLGDYHGTLELYNQMQGKLWNGNPIINPNTGDSTIFMLSGDPVNNSGWYEGDGWPAGPSPGNRFDLLSSGPFNMEPGEEQEIVYAIVVARGSDNLNSIIKLKEKAADVQHFWNDYKEEDYKARKDQIIKEYNLSQNYPNPFNSTTTIYYTIPHSTGSTSPADVKLVVYDILGREVATLVDEPKIPGKYWVKFDDSSVSRQLASGVYFYRLSISDYVQTKKMILLK